MIKMDQVVMLELGAVKQISDDSGIIRNLNSDGVFDCPHRGQSMGVRSNAARALNKMLGISGIPSLKNKFNAPKHLPGTPGVNDFASGHLNFYAKVAFDSGNRIYRDSLGHMVSSLF